MKKPFAIIAAVLITCGITVAPAFADEVNLEGGDVIDGVVYVHAPISTDTPPASDDNVVITEDENTDDTSSSLDLQGRNQRGVGMIKILCGFTLVVLSLPVLIVSRSERMNRPTISGEYKLSPIVCFSVALLCIPIGLGLIFL